MVPLPVDDIPVAERTYKILSNSRRKSSTKISIVFSGLFIAGTLVALFNSPMARFLAPPPVPGLEARLSTDGRLLGHFPYPEAAHSQLRGVGAGMFLHSEAAASFEAMQRAAKADGVSLVLLSGFRSVEQQRALFFEVKANRNQTASDRARVSAPPGYSEHSTGYAIDIGDLHQPETNLSPSFVHTPAFNWLRNHAARFQFTLSFPKENPQGVSFEPWHWRFEGSTDALKLFEPANRLQSASSRGRSASAP